MTTTGATAPLLPWLVHRDGAGTARERDSFRAEVGGTGLVLETCLRRLAFGAGAAPPLSGELLTGGEAYRSLLEIVAGLRSAVIGETNVAGQFRRAWADGAASLAPTVRATLAPLVTAVLADAASVRRTHLQGIGGSSWGTLVRRLLAPPPGARVLLVGAGDLAASIAPYLGRVELGLWNRRAVTPERRRLLAAVGRWFDVAEADLAADWADVAILTSPADVDHDGAWLARFAARTVPLRGGVHLGQRTPTAFRWPAGQRGFLLDDVLDLARSQQHRRTAAVAAARAHCGLLASERYGTPAPATVRQAQG